MSDGIAYNQAFFDQMERDYSAICARDGWEEVRKAQQELHSRPKERPGQIPAESDYFRAQVPAGRDRELRLGVTEGSRVPKAPAGLSQGSERRRNLDELRRVEAATREAVDRELAQAAAQAEARRGGPPIRTRSDTVVVSSLSDSEDDDAKAREEARIAYQKIWEIKCAGREREDRMAMWRARWG